MICPFLNHRSTKILLLLEMAVKILDGATITIADQRATWASYRKNLFGIKVHMLIDEALTLIEDMKVTVAKAADVTVAKSFEFLAKNLYVMDRAYFDAKWLYKLNENGVFFVMRLKSNVVYHVVKERALNHPNIVAIKKIQLMGPKTEAYCEHLKLFVLRDEKSGKTIEVITNHHDLSAKQVSAIYRQRWQIEIFFRTLKQNLQIKRFYGRNENAMKNQIWIAMIVYLLLWILHRLSGAKQNFLDFLRTFQSRLFQAEIITKKTDRPMSQFQLFQGLPGPTTG